MTDKFLVTLDAAGYRRKPGRAEMAALTARLQKADATECDAARLCEHVRAGRSWVGATYAPSAGKWGAFEQQRIFAVDVDNKQDGDFLPYTDALDRCGRLKLAPLCLYFTLSANCPDVQKYRLVFDMGESLRDEREAREVAKLLLTAFPEADRACKNPNRIWLGSNGEVIETWRDGVLYHE